tara:strand:+ start:184 stop:1062 length:879 start_codon:yes stop_codon:yes gene_type:complete
MRLHVVDGTFELYRAHFSRRPDRLAADGTDIKATLGVMDSLLALFSDPREHATHIAVAFDNPIESFRNDLFADYKTGEGMEPALVAQMDLVEEAVAALGIVVWSMDRFEADDALATAANRWREAVTQVRIMTPDKDLGQMVAGSKIVQVDRIRNRVIDEDGVRARNGCDPTSIPDWLALVGDSADGIPGITGFGAKTAAKLLSVYGSIEAIPSNCDDWAVPIRGAPRLATTLKEHLDEARLYRVLATLATNVPLEENLEDLLWRGADPSLYQRISERLGTSTPEPLRWRSTR